MPLFAAAYVGFGMASNTTGESEHGTAPMSVVHTQLRVGAVFLLLAVVEVLRGIRAWNGAHPRRWESGVVLHLISGTLFLWWNALVIAQNAG